MPLPVGQRTARSALIRTCVSLAASNVRVARSSLEPLHDTPRPHTTPQPPWRGGGIAKDLSDVEGDRIAGRRTLPIVVGERSARRLLAAVAAVVALSFGGAARISSAPLVWSAGVVLIGAVVVGRPSFASPTSRDRRRTRSPYRAFMWAQHATHIVLAATIWGLPH